ncbi:unnamed protein product [Symbiodinium sp. KB8]|nr:unnamed protein product [Symbiodinium sp. KB8]
MRQLVFQNLHAMARLPKNPEQMIDEPRLYKKARMPRNTCGIDATYYIASMSQFVAINGDNQSEVWIGPGGLPPKGSCNGWGCYVLSTGTGLCGTYVWWGVSKVQSNGVDTGDAFEMKFIFNNRMLD